MEGALGKHKTDSKAPLDLPDCLTLAPLNESISQTMHSPPIQKGPFNGQISGLENGKAWIRGLAGTILCRMGIGFP